MQHDFSITWLRAIGETFKNGHDVAPRDQSTKEILQRTMEVDMRKPVLCVPARKLSYQFMAAEAFWILSGDNRVESIAPYNKNISQFSDDGKTFFGAYGPQIASQLDYVVSKLLDDRDTRQAGLTIWSQNPPQTKDVPCTISIFFNIRDGKLNCHVFMRSSDIWLGVPYDVFNFSMLSHLVCGFLHESQPSSNAVKPGKLFLTAASSHLYTRNWDVARSLRLSEMLNQAETPKYLWTSTQTLMDELKYLRTSKPGDGRRWWEM